MCIKLLAHRVWVLPQQKMVTTSLPGFGAKLFQVGKSWRSGARREERKQGASGQEEAPPIFVGTCLSEVLGLDTQDCAHTVLLRVIR